MARVKLVEDALCDPHAGGGVATVDVRHLQLTLSSEVALQVPAEGFREHRFPAAHRSRDHCARCAFGRSYVGKFRRQFALDVLSAHQFIGDVVKIQHLWMGDDEPSADAVKIVHHIKGMLMSTVLKDVVSKRLHRSPFPRRGPGNQGISSN